MTDEEKLRVVRRRMGGLYTDVYLSAMAGYTNKEIALKYDIKTARVRTMITKCLRAISREEQKQQEDEEMTVQYIKDYEEIVGRKKPKEKELLRNKYNMLAVMRKNMPKWRNKIHGTPATYIVSYELWGIRCEDVFHGLNVWHAWLQFMELQPDKMLNMMRNVQIRLDRRY